MSAQALANKAIANAVPVAIGIGVILFAAYFVLRKAVGEVADTAGGILSGNNALTEGTAYEGAGIAGTLGAGANALSGGSLQALGERIATWFEPESTGQMYTYIATFPDGAKHGVNSEDIDKSGVFTRDGVRYRLGTSTSNQRVAVRV